MRKLYVTDEEWEIAARKYYKYLTGDSVVVPDWICGTYWRGVITSFYTTDQFNHEAPPHQRFVVKLDDGKQLDVSKQEIMTLEEWQTHV